VDLVKVKGINMSTRLALAVIFLLSQLAFAAPVVLKIGSIAPRESPWGQVLRVWMKAVKEKSKGEVEIEIYWNATQGDETAQMSKMKTGQLDGAIVSAVGLSVVDSRINVLQVPGLYKDWPQLDKVRNALKPRFDESFHMAGFELVGWGDIGLDRLMSKGYALKSPADFKGKRPWCWKDDPVLPPFFQAVGVVPVLTSLPEAVAELSTGNVNAMSVSALAAEQLQWSPRLDHVSNMVVAPNIGGMVLSLPKLKTLTSAQQDIVLQTGRLATKALTDRIRKEDAQAFERLKKRMTLVEYSEAELKAWNAVFADTRTRLSKGTFAPELFAEIDKLLKE
jgi:TRAP-type transport system periplasmic protein